MASSGVLGPILGRVGIVGIRLMHLLVVRRRPTLRRRMRKRRSLRKWHPTISCPI